MKTHKISGVVQLTENGLQKKKKKKKRKKKRKLNKKKIVQIDLIKIDENW